MGTRGMMTETTATMMIGTDVRMMTADRIMMSEIEGVMLGEGTVAATHRRLKTRRRISSVGQKESVDLELKFSVVRSVAWLDMSLAREICWRRLVVLWQV